MMHDEHCREFRFHAALLAALLRCLPRRSYRRYGEELAGVYRDMLLEASEAAGMRAARRRMPGLLADACTAVCLEYIDVWRRSRLSPPRFAVAALIGAGAVWGLVAAAAVGDARWAAAILDLNLAVSLSLMLGLPALALVASRVGAGAAAERRASPVLGASIAATAVTWTIATCHIAA